MLKAIRGNELLTAVRDVAAGKSLLEPVATARVPERLRGGNKPGGDERVTRSGATRPEQRDRDQGP